MIEITLPTVLIGIFWGLLLMFVVMICGVFVLATLEAGFYKLSVIGILIGVALVFVILSIPGTGFQIFDISLYSAGET